MKKIIIFSLWLSSCAYGPSQEKKSSLNYLSGEHYQESASVLGVPVAVERKIKETVISGRIQMDDPFSRFPEIIELNLISNGRIMSSTRPNRTGFFEFRGLFSDGDYSVKSVATNFSGESFFKINSYKISDVLVTIYKNQQSLQNGQAR